MDIVNIFGKARIIRDRAKLVDQKIKELFEVLSPTNYAPFVEFDEFTWFVQGVRAINQEFGDDIAWYFWEITIDGTQVWNIIETNEKTHGIKDDETMIAYLQYKYQDEK